MCNRCFNGIETFPSTKTRGYGAAGAAVLVNGCGKF
jgi:hypothetical protein